MTTKRAKHSPNEDLFGEQEVAEYLRAHPEFFEHQPRLLTELRVPHPSGKAVSLVERLVDNLREQLDQERHKLAQLIALAKENQTLNERLHRLTLALIDAPDLAESESLLQSQLQKEFSADGVQLKLYPKTQLESPANGSAATTQDPVLDQFMGFLLAAKPVCGPLEPEQRKSLFNDSGQDIRSAALIPLQADDFLGILAIGSADAERFHAQMGTDFLGRLGAIVSHKLRNLTAGHE
jgi:uncharacterized protein YigA (DUF484 family)